MGRPTKLDDLVSHRILDAVRNGVSRASAAHGARIGYSTLKTWLAQGREGVEPYASFLAGLQEAEATAERTIVDQLFEAARKGHVGAMCFWLERRRYEGWGRRDAPVDDQPEAGEASGVELTEEMLDSVRDAVRSRKAG